MKKALSIIVLVILTSGCSMFSAARMRGVIIDKEEAVYGIIPGEPYKIIDMEGKERIVKFEEENWYIVNDAALVKAETRKNKAFIRKVKFTRREKAMAAVIIPILGIALELLRRNSKRKKKKKR